MSYLKEKIHSITGAIKSKLPGYCKCLACGRAYKIKNLKYKRLLSRKEAELLEGRLILNSHFVYACPECTGDILDIKGHKRSKSGRKK